jgi:hypothetical protein
MGDWHPIYAAGFTDGLRVALAIFVWGFVVTLLVRAFR